MKTIALFCMLLISTPVLAADLICLMETNGETIPLYFEPKGEPAVFRGEPAKRESKTKQFIGSHFLDILGGAIEGILTSPF